MAQRQQAKASANNEKEQLTTQTYSPTSLIQSCPGWFQTFRLPGELWTCSGWNSHSC